MVQNALSSFGLSFNLPLRMDGLFIGYSGRYILDAVCDIRLPIVLDLRYMDEGCSCLNLSVTTSLLLLSHHREHFGLQYNAILFRRMWEQPDTFPLYKLCLP
jgi:hypothetical protein